MQLIMVHSVVVDDKVVPLLKELGSTGQVQTGILIGQSMKVKDYVLLAVRTPSLQELDKTEDSEDTLKHSSSADHFEDWWVVEHAKQVINLLPGGLEVVGLLCVCPKDLMGSLQLTLVKILSQLSPQPQATLLHHCTVSNKTTGHLLDSQGGIRPAGVKFQANPVQLIKVESILRLTCDWCEHLLGNKPEAILKSLQALVADSLEKLFSEPLLRVNGRFVDEGDLLVPKTKRTEPSVPEGGVKLDIFTRHQPEYGESVEVVREARRVGLTGPLPLIAYLHYKANYRDALQALKEDATRSLSSQLLALTEADNALDVSTGVTSSLPCRLSVTVPSVPWALSEYSLPGEDLKECEARVCELLGVPSATTVGLSPSTESFPLSPTKQQAVFTDSPPSPTEHHTTLADSSNQSGNRDGHTKFWILLTAVLVLLLAIATWVTLYS